MKKFSNLLGALTSALAMSTQVFAAENPIVFGQSAPLTGPAAELGKGVKLGAEVFFNSVNAAGGIKGRKIVLRSLDDGYEPPRAEKNTREFIAQDDVLALFGYVGTPTSAVSIPLSTQAKVPFVGAYTGAELLRTPANKYIFNIRASYFDETEAIVRQLTSFSWSKIAVLYQNDAYGEAGLKGVEQALNRRNLKVHAKATVERNSVDVAKAVDALSGVKAEAIVLISTYKSCAAFIKAMKAKGSTAMMYNVSFVGTKALAAELGSDAKGVAVSQVVPSPWSGKYNIVSEYRRAMEAAGHKNFDFTSLEGYIAAKVVTEALKNGGDKNREALVAALEKIDNYNAGGMYFTFSPTRHDASKFVDLTILSANGEVRD